MRTIKFQAWHKLTKKMATIDAILWSTHGYFAHTSDGFSGSGSLDDIELREFTGLQDRTGKDIYEGDILRLESSYHKTYEVYWDDDSWGLRHGNEDYDNDDYYRGDIINNWHEWEVVGNIYENPDLLKRR